MAYFEQFTPKHHITSHMLFGIATNGNPTWYSTWTDEAINKKNKQVCREVSQTTFDIRVLRSIRIMLNPLKQDRKRKR
jgi:hypothetical protein